MYHPPCAVLAFVSQVQMVEMDSALADAWHQDWSKDQEEAFALALRDNNDVNDKSNDNDKNNHSNSKNGDNDNNNNNDNDNPPTGSTTLDSTMDSVVPGTAIVTD